MRFRGPLWAYVVGYPSQYTVLVICPESTGSRELISADVMEAGSQNSSVMHRSKFFIIYTSAQSTGYLRHAKIQIGRKSIAQPRRVLWLREKGTDLLLVNLDRLIG